MEGGRRGNHTSDFSPAAIIDRNPLREVTWSGDRKRQDKKLRHVSSLKEHRSMATLGEALCKR